MTWDERPVERLSIHVFEIANRSSVPIMRADLRSIQITATEGEILTAVPINDEEVVDFQTAIVDGAVEVHFDFLNPGRRAILGVLHTALPNTNWRVMGSIVGGDVRKAPAVRVLK